MDQQKMKEMNLVEIEDDLTPEERAYWEASIERDLREIAEGKPRKYISGDEFWGKLTNAVLRHYEKV
ncbi:MAG: hypothetical protein J6S82_05240 [Bacteroidales bacterium]|nr:hypothetical protein [Bacteroidales bacterium]